MKTAILPIDVEIWYENEKEKNYKINVIKDLLTEITKSDDKVNDMKKLHKYLSIIKWNKRTSNSYIKCK